MRISLQGLVTDEQYRIDWINSLDLLDERRQQAFDHLKVYQARISKGYNKKVKPRKFEVGDLILKENPKNQPNREQKGNFEPNWLGPYVITATFGTGAYQLATPEGDFLPDPINTLHLKWFYA